MPLPTPSSRARATTESATLAISARIQQLQAEGQKVISLAIGEPDFDTPAQIASAGIEAIRTVFEAAGNAVDTVPEIYGFTRTIRNNFTHAERVTMLELLWEVAYADGVLHDYEASLLRQVTGLLYVTDQESGAARKRALERLRE